MIRVSRLIMVPGLLFMLFVLPPSLQANSIELFNETPDSASDNSNDGFLNEEGSADGLFSSDSIQSLTSKEGYNTYSSGSDRTEEMTMEEAEIVVDKLLTEAQSGVPGTLDKYNELIAAMEVLSPESSAADITRLLRRQYYGDEMLQFAGQSPAEGEPRISPELRAFENRLHVLKNWQVISKSDGTNDKFDFGHSLVGLDAYAWQPGLGGRAKGYLFTFLGDYGSQVFTWCGADGAGDWNREDHTGNVFGRRMTNLYADDKSLSLSDMISTAKVKPGITKYYAF